MFRKHRLFAEEVVPLHKTLVALGRLKNLIKIASETYMRQWRLDSDVFRPSNLDEGKIINHIEIAIDEVEKNSALPENEKKQLTEYLYNAKNELAEDRPSWNKVVGALIIAAAIIGGIANLPQACENINEAVKHILGSVERQIPSTMPLLEKTSTKKTKMIQTYSPNKKMQSDAAEPRR